MHRGRNLAAHIPNMILCDHGFEEGGMEDMVSAIRRMTVSASLSSLGDLSEPICGGGGLARAVLVW